MSEDVEKKQGTKELRSMSLSLSLQVTEAKLYTLEQKWGLTAGTLEHLTESK